MAIQFAGYEFDLTVKQYGYKRDYYGDVSNSEKKPELVEELKFNSLSAVEVLRKLIDYIQSK